MKGSFDSGKFSGLIATSFPILKMKKNDIEKGKTLGKIMISKIDHLYIGFTPLFIKAIHRFTNYIANFRQKYPNLLAKRCVHSNIFLATEKIKNDNYDDILIEYGTYRKDYDDYKHEAFLIDKTGLRFTEMTLEEFKTRMISLNRGTNNIPYIKCNVNSRLSFHRLIENIIFGSSNNSILYEILSDINENKIYIKTFSGKNYDLFTYNCQTFVAKLIEACQSTISLEDRLYSQNYENLKVYIPPIIVEALEKNYNIIDIDNGNESTITTDDNHDNDDNSSVYSNISFKELYHLDLIWD